MLIIIFFLLQLLIVALLSPLIIGCIKKVKAFFQNRRGPRLLQLYYDIIKYFSKDTAFSPTASWIFYITPYVYFASILIATILLPLNSSGGMVSCDVFLWVYILAIGRFFLVLSSMDTGSAFGGMGGAREAFISTLIEPALFLALLTVINRASSTDMYVMATATVSAPFTLPNILAMAAFFMLLLAETGRIPIDNPDTHLELTMVHEGMLLEYSGKKLALLVWGAAIKQLLFIVLFVLYFVPWHWPAEVLIPLDMLWFILKVTVVCIGVAIVESSTNKLRLFRVPFFLMVSGMLSLLAMIAQ